MLTRLSLALLLALPAVAPAAERSFLVTDFDKVRVEGAFDVRLATGRAPSARVGGTTQAVDAVEIRNDNRTLVVRSRSDASGGGDLPVVRLSTHELTGLLLVGGGTMSVDRVKAGSAQVLVDGAGSIEVGALDVDALSAQARGSARLTLAGRVRAATLTLSGDGAIAAPALQANEARIANSGSGSVALTAVRSAEVRQTGAGRVTVYGSPTCTILSRGAGIVTCRNPRTAGTTTARADPDPPVPPRAWAAALPAPDGRPGRAGRR